MTTIRFAKPHILDQLSPDRHGVVEASAGTGKTYTLKHLVVDLLLSKGAPTIDSILIVTFTRRATADLRRQIREVLAKILSAEKDSQLEDGEPYWVIDDDARTRLREALLHFEKAQIYTIHSFCQRLLVENAFENDQLFDLKLVDEKALFDDCFEDFVRGPLSREPELRRYFDLWLGDPIGSSIGDLSNKLYEFHNQKAENICFAHSDSFDVLYEDLTGPNKVYHDNKRKTDAGNKRRLNDLKMWVVRELYGHLKEEIDARKERDGLYCYDDMLELVWKGLEGGDERGFSFLENIRAQYQFALVDEFQDTDRVQWKIIERVFVDGTDDHRLYIVGDPKQSIYGFRGADVWSFLRASQVLGGDRAVLEHNYRSTHEMVAAYNEIFRQDEEVEAPFFACSSINYLSPVKGHPKEPHRVRYMNRSDERVPVSICALELGFEDLEREEPPCWKEWIVSEIWSLLYGDERLEVEFEDDSEGIKKWRAVGPQDIFVLTNAGKEGVEIGELLRERGIPFSFFRQEGLFQGLEALDILNLLKGIASPREMKVRRAAYRTPFFGIPLKALAEFDDDPILGGEAQRRLTSWQKVATTKNFVRLFDRILNESGLLRRELLLGASAQSRTNYEHIFEILTLKAASDGATLEDLIAWLEAKIAAKKDADDDGEDDSDIQRQESERPAVQVMTIHKAKGLEAEVVFIYGGFSTASAGKIVSFFDADNPTETTERLTCFTGAKDYFKVPKKAQARRLASQQVWEDERVMYVAITRAKSRAYICYANPTMKQRAKKRQSTYRRGRHAPLMRALDRIKADKEAGSTNQALDFIEFITFEEAQERLNSQNSARIAKKAGERPDFWASLLKSYAELLAARKELKEEQEKDGDKSPRRLRATSARQSHSFSGISRYQGGEVSFKARVDETEQELAEELEEEQEKTIWEKIRDDRFQEETPLLAGGMRAGSLLHEILEEIDDYREVFEYESAARWLGQSAAGEVLRELCKKFRVAEEVESYIARILFDSLRAPLKLPGGAELQGIGDAHRMIKEKSFRFPIPQQGLSLDLWEKPKGRPTRGWIEGSMDLIFEVEGKIYLADWKSSVRESYKERDLQEYLELNYKLQVQLYTLALVQMLGIESAADYDEKFGGCAYFFVRAMRPDRPGEGVAWARRPAWEELKRWYEEMGQRRPREWREIASVFGDDKQRDEVMDGEEFAEVLR